MTIEQYMREQARDAFYDMLFYRFIILECCICEERLDSVEDAKRHLKEKHIARDKEGVIR